MPIPAILPLVLATLTASAVPPATRMEVLVDQTKARAKPDDALPPELSCTRDKRWCLELSRDVDANTYALNIFDGRKPRTADGKAQDVQSYPVGSAPDEAGFEREGLRLWPQIIRETSAETPRDGEERGETISIGLLASSSTMYSGGGAQADRLRLLRFAYSPYGAAQMQEMLDVPYRGRIMIRACFADADFEKRGGACHDLYDFDATLVLDPQRAKNTPPRLIFQTKAVATPGTSRRSNDNSTGKKLSPRDVLPALDSECTYRRVVAYNPATLRYEFDRPAPDCSDYTVP
jgi:hypothetical protein